MIRQAYPITSLNDAASEHSIADRLFSELDKEGIVVLPKFARC